MIKISNSTFTDKSKLEFNGYIKSPLGVNISSYVKKKVEGEIVDKLRLNGLIYCGTIEFKKYDISSDTINKVIDYVVAWYDGDNDKCFDEDRFPKECFDKAYRYYKDMNEGYEEDCDYVKLYASIEKIGLVLLGDFKPKINN